MPFIFSFLLELLFFFKNMTNTQYPSQIRTKKTGLLGLWDSCLLSLLLLQQSWCHWCKKMNLGLQVYSMSFQKLKSHPITSTYKQNSQNHWTFSWTCKYRETTAQVLELGLPPISVEKHQPLRLHITWVLSVANRSRQRQAITLHFSKRFSWMTQ